MRIIRQWLTDRDGSARTDILTLFIIFGVAFLQTLGRFPLIEPDEGRYAEIPREMLERGDFITPLLDYVKYFEKPPLHYWLNALSMSIFGQNEFAVRLPGAMMGLLTVLLVYHAGRKLFGRRTGLLAALVLGTCTGFLVQARVNIIDMTLTCTLSASLAFFILAAREEERRKGLYYCLTYLCAALAVLAKGLIGIVFPGAIIFLYLLFTKRWRLLREMRLATGIALFLLVAAPWFTLVSLKNPEFARFFFIHEHFERFLTKVHGRYEPFWFFVPILVGTMLPWSFFILSGLRGIWRARQDGEGNSRFYLLVWAAFIFLFFSKSDSKLVPYILPVFPPLTLLIGHALSQAMDGEAGRLKLPALVSGGFLAVLGIGIVLYQLLAAKPAFGFAGAALLGILFLGEGIAAFAFARKGDTTVFVASFCLVSYLLGIFGPPVIYAGVAEKKSTRELALIVKRLAPEDAVIASFGYEQGLPFYTKRRTIVVGDRNELNFGSHLGDQSAWFMEPEQFAQIWDGKSEAFALIRSHELSRFMEMVKTPVREVGRNRRAILITNR
jgi:4-amino-4-deoxy-L-arabinose transferase-like glycosyltransferase